MKEKTKIVISASRRTDIPAFHMPWFMARIKQGSFILNNPVTRKRSILKASPSDIHTIIFWSKNLRPLLEKNYDRKLTDIGYNLFFNFTINSENSILEPCVPPLKQRLKDLKNLSRFCDPRSINWRFDPICFYLESSGNRRNNLKDFLKIADMAAECGITRCITSFVDLYKKVLLRAERASDITFSDPPMEQKVEILLRMEKVLEERNIRLFTCCEGQVMENLPEFSTIRSASCSPNTLLMELFGGKLSRARDQGQRKQSGCGCMKSVDVGSYESHACPHGCLYCYR